MFRGSVAKFRQLGGKVSLTEKIYASSKNINYILYTVCSLLLPMLLFNVHRSQYILPRLRLILPRTGAGVTDISFRSGVGVVILSLSRSSLFPKFYGRARGKEDES